MHAHVDLELHCPRLTENILFTDALHLHISVRDIDMVFSILKNDLWVNRYKYLHDFLKAVRSAIGRYENNGTDILSDSGLNTIVSVYFLNTEIN